MSYTPDQERSYRGSLRSYLYTRPATYQWLFDKLVEFLGSEEEAQRFHVHLFGGVFSTPSRPTAKPKAKNYAPSHRSKP